jgi:hypothetical protein
MSADKDWYLGQDGRYHEIIKKDNGFVLLCDKGFQLTSYPSKIKKRRLSEISTEEACFACLEDNFNSLMQKMELGIR